MQGGGSYLESINIAVNTELQVLCCIICQVALAPDHISGHIANCHPGIQVNDMQYCQAVTDSKVPMTLPNTVPGGRYRRPYNGLAIHDGIICHHCKFACKSLSWMKQHHQQEHPSLIFPKQWSSCRMQQLNGGANKQFWQVAGDDDEEAHNHQEAIDRMRTEMAGVTSIEQVSQDNRMVSPWLRTTKWHEHVAGHDTLALRKLVEIPKTDDIEMPGLQKAVEGYFKHTLTLLDLTDELILQRLNSPDPVKE
jgi:hypothetical protein